MERLNKALLPLVPTAACVLAWVGVDFSPGFSESFAACFVTAQAALFLLRKPLWRWVGLLGALLLAAGSYVYTAGDDHLTVCTWAALAGAVLCCAFQPGSGKDLSERLLRAALLAAGLFTLLCGFFSTALLPPGLGALLCLAGRYSGRARSGLTLSGLLLCDLFLLAPMCFPGGV